MARVRRARCRRWRRRRRRRQQRWRRRRRRRRRRKRRRRRRRRKRRRRWWGLLARAWRVAVVAGDGADVRHQCVGRKPRVCPHFSATAPGYAPITEIRAGVSVLRHKPVWVVHAVPPRWDWGWLWLWLWHWHGPTCANGSVVGGGGGRVGGGGGGRGSAGRGRVVTRGRARGRVHYEREYAGNRKPRRSLALVVARGGSIGALSAHAQKVVLGDTVRVELVACVVHVSLSLRTERAVVVGRDCRRPHAGREACRVHTCPPLLLPLLLHRLGCASVGWSDEAVRSTCLSGRYTHRDPVRRFSSPPQNLRPPQQLGGFWPQSTNLCFEAPC
jgi:hypothetical protein